MDSHIPASFFEPFVPKNYVKTLDTPPRPLAYKSAAEKFTCQDMIRRRVRPYLAKYISSIQPEIHRRIYDTDLSEYATELASAWRRHNEINDVVDLFLYHQWITPLKDWSLEEWKIARKLFVAVIDVDHTKNIYSGGLKEKIELEAGRIRGHLRIEDDQLILLLNPASGTFYTLYRKEYIALHFEAVAAGMQVTIRNWGYQDIIEQLRRGNPSIIGIKLNNILHWIIARGYRGKRLNIIDPLNEIRTIHRDNLEQLVTTSMGKRLIVIEKFPDNFFDEIQGQLSKAQDYHQ